MEMVGILFLVIISLFFSVHLLNVEYGKRIHSCLYQTAKGNLQILQNAAVIEICLFIRYCCLESSCNYRRKTT